MRPIDFESLTNSSDVHDVNDAILTHFCNLINEDLENGISRKELADGLDRKVHTIIPYINYNVVQLSPKTLYAYLKFREISEKEFYEPFINLTFQVCEACKRLLPYQKFLLDRVYEKQVCGTCYGTIKHVGVFFNKPVFLSAKEKETRQRILTQPWGKKNERTNGRNSIVICYFNTRRVVGN